MVCTSVAWLLFTCSAFICSTQAYCAHDYSNSNDTEAWARRSYFYVGGQYVKTTLVILCI